MHIYKKIFVLIITFSPTCFGAYYAIFKGEFFYMLKTITIVTANKKVLPEDGAISAETYRRKGDN